MSATTMMDRGYLTVMRVRGVPIRLHWTLPLGALLFSGGRIAPGAWLGLLLVVALHEAGHAFLVHRSRLVNLGIDLTGFGGRCRWAGRPTELQRAWIAWGGVLAQLVVLALALTVQALVGTPRSLFAADLLSALVTTNAFLIAVNLIPMEPLDGREAWPLFKHLARERARRRKWREGRSSKGSASREAPRVAEPSQPQTLREALAEADRQARKDR